jgi:hypothetical protein
MRHLTILLSLLIVLPVQAAERRLSGAEINDLLPRILAKGETTGQTFETNGETEFMNGNRPSLGRWRVQNDFYCSSWPPGDGWRCYHVLVDEKSGDEPNIIIWVDADLGERTINTILPKGQ